MREHPRADLYIRERQTGKSVREIAKEQGVSVQAVAQAISHHAPTMFRPYTEKNCVYPNWRKWLNDNRVTRKEFLSMIGLVPVARNSSRLSNYMLGKKYPQKEVIDKFLQVTGLTYEELWRKDEDR